MNGRTRLDWINTAIQLAHDIARYRSEDPYVQVGACAIKHDSSIILGYNGAPSGVDIDWSNRDERRKRVLHAESNVLNFVKPGEVQILAVTHLPCIECLKIIKQKKIHIVYFSHSLDNYNPEEVHKIAFEYGIKLVPIVK
jgi:deoxycytidylate deaminase